jgi:hypothetical protein
LRGARSKARIRIQPVHPVNEVKLIHVLSWVNSRNPFEAEWLFNPPRFKQTCRSVVNDYWQ